MSDATSAAGIVVREVGKTFRRARSKETIEALRNVSVEIGHNSFVCLVGPSGCGKTTLLRMLNGLIHPELGRNPRGR